MKIKLTLLTALLVLSLKCHCQCELKFIKANGTPSDLEFYIIISPDTLFSDGASITIDKDLFEKYADKKFKVYFDERSKQSFGKLYEKPKPIKRRNTLKEICQTYKLEKKTL